MTRLTVLIPNPHSLITDATRVTGNSLVAALLAPACAVCDTVLDEPLSGCVCRTCWAAIRPITPPVCDACGDPLARRAQSPLTSLRTPDDTESLIPSPHPQSLCALCGRHRSTITRARAVGEYRGRAQRHHPRAEVRWSPVAGTSPCRPDARSRGRTSHRGRLCGAGPASLEAGILTRLQSGPGAVPASWLAGGRGLASRTAHTSAGRAGRRSPPGKRRRRVPPASRSAVQAAHLGNEGVAHRRCEHDRRDVGILCPGAEGVGGRRGLSAHDRTRRHARPRRRVGHLLRMYYLAKAATRLSVRSPY